MAVIIHKRPKYTQVSTSFIWNVCLLLDNIPKTVNSEKRSGDFYEFTWLSNTMFRLQQIYRANKQIFYKTRWHNNLPIFRETKDKLFHSYLWALPLLHSAWSYQSIFHLYHSQIFTIPFYLSLCVLIEIFVPFYASKLKKTVRKPFVWYGFDFLMEDVQS